MSNLNIGMVLPPDITGGTKAYLVEIIPRLRERGHKVVLITPEKYQDAFDVDATETYRPSRFPVSNYGASPIAMTSTLKALRKHSVDIVHIHAYPIFLADYLTITHPLHRKPLIITFNGSFHQFASFKIRCLKKLHNTCMLRFKNSVDRFIAISQAEKKEVIKGGIPEEKIRVVYYGVSNRHSKFVGWKSEESSERKILYVGRLTSTKNPSILVEAMSRVVQRNNNVKLIMAGPDFGERRNLEKLVSKLGIEKYVEFTGEVTEGQKRQLLGSCDVFVHPTPEDIWSLSLLEASAAGLPIVAFNIGGNSEMIIDGKTGMLVDNLSSEALAEAILKIINNRRDDIREMGEEGRRFVCSKFSWEEAVDALVSVYQEAQH